jgi:hypothetical protein
VQDGVKVHNDDPLGILWGMLSLLCFNAVYFSMSMLSGE